MNPPRARAIFPFFFLVMILVLVIPAYADELVVSTNKPSYSLGATINVYGRLTWGVSPVTNGLVAVQVEDSIGNLKFIRTVNTGTPPPPWKVRIISFLSCDSQGNPKNSFSRGSLSYFSITVESLDTVIERQVTMALNMFDSIGESIATTYGRFALAPGKQFTLFTSMPIPNDAFLGAAACCASVLTNWPKESNGYPYCSEQYVEFAVTGAGSQGSNTSSALSATGSGGSYSLSFKLSAGASLGNYVVYAGARYNALANAVFDYYWLTTDVTRDGTVNIVDISIAGKTFGTKIGDLKYNRLADINNDNAVNILDVSSIGKDFGKTMRRA